MNLLGTGREGHAPAQWSTARTAREKEPERGKEVGWDEALMAELSSSLPPQYLSSTIEDRLCLGVASKLDLDGFCS